MATATEKLYELAYLASPDLDEQGLGTLKNDVDALVVKLGGSIRENGNPVKKRLAYPIAKHATAFLVSEQITLTAEAKKALAKDLDLNGKILRHVFVALTEKFLKRLRERKVAQFSAIAREGAKERATAAKATVAAQPGISAAPTTDAAPEKTVEEKKIDIAEIEKKLDEILGREL